MGNYKKLDSADITYIKEIVKDEERVLTGDFINEEYSHDELGGTSSYPDVVVRAKSPEEIAAIMKYAYEHTIPVTPRGAGTGLVGSSVAIEHGIMIDTTLMNHILELDEENLTVTVEPGVLLMELGAYVEEHDFFYPPDPGEKISDHRRKYQYECRWYESGKIWCDKRLCDGTGGSTSEWRDHTVWRKSGKEQFRL